jgi:hypothetical protein
MTPEEEPASLRAENAAQREQGLRERVTWRTGVRQWRRRRGIRHVSSVEGRRHAQTCAGRRRG